MIVSYVINFLCSRGLRCLLAVTANDVTGRQLLEWILQNSRLPRVANLGKKRVTCSSDLGCSIGTRVTRVTRVVQSKSPIHFLIPRLPIYRGSLRMHSHRSASCVLTWFAKCYPRFSTALPANTTNTFNQNIIEQFQIHKLSK